MSPALAFSSVVIVTLLLGSRRVPVATARRALVGLSSDGAEQGRRAKPWVEGVLVELGLTQDPAAAWRIARSIAAAMVVSAAAVGGVIPGALTLAALAVVPEIARQLLERRRLDRRDDQLPDALERLASSLRAGVALGPAFASVAHATPPPLGVDLRAAASLLHHGAGLTAALDHWCSGATSGPEVRLTAAALGLAADAGGEVARSVDRVAATLRERREVRAEAKALATQARASAAVLGMAPLAFTALVASVEPEALTFLLTSRVGLACLVGGLALEAAGAAWMARILRSVA